MQQVTAHVEALNAVMNSSVRHDGQALERKRACAGTGSRPAFDPRLMMAVPVPFFTCAQFSWP